MNSRLNKPFFFAFSVGLATAIVFSITIILSYQYYQKQKIQQLQLELNFVKENIRKIMTNSNLAAFSVGLTIDPVQDTVKNFDFVAKEIMQQHPYIFGVQILRKGEIQYVYPFERHKSVLGYDILENQSTQIEAQRAIDEKEIYYAGPLSFKQGGQGIIARLPIFHNQKFWGFSAVLIRMDDFLEASGIRKSEFDNFIFELSKINPNTGKEEYFTNRSGASNLSLDYTFAESGWKITANYQSESIVYIILSILIILGIFSTAGSSQHAYQILKRPEKLEALLNEKTKEIEENNAYLQSMVQAIPDIIFIYDEQATYLDFHAYKTEFLLYKPKDFIGKTAYELFDKGFAKETHACILKALKTSEVIEHSYYLDFKEDRKFFEGRYISINSEKVLAVIREVTESVLSAQRLEKSEQKYRGLVSQASDTIFLSDENGNLIELNNKGIEMTGLNEKQIKEYNLNDILILSNEKHSKITKLIHEKGNTLQEGSLKKSDGTEIPVEINCKITASKQIQGIIRDVSARKKYIQSIQLQNEKLKEIAWIQSHEVRAPLARILGLLDYLEKYDEGTKADNNHIISSLRKSSLDLDLIIRDLVKKSEEAESSTS